MNPEREAGRVSGRSARTKSAKGRAPDMASIITDLRASGATSLRQITASLDEWGIRAVRGGTWSAVQVQRVLEHVRSSHSWF